MKVTVSAPGKIHLMGEHAVVHGAPALLAAIDKRIYVTVSFTGHNEGKENIQIVSTETDDYIRQVVQIAGEKLGVHDMPHLVISVNSDIPAGYHLGSSAAVAVAVTGALMYILKKIWNPVRINEIAYEAEQLKHGNPSGGDNTAVTFGGFLWFRKELEFLKSMWQLPFRTADSLTRFYVIDTGRPLETMGEMVAHVAARVKKHPKKFRSVIYQNEIQTKRLTRAIKEGNEKELVDSIRAGQRTLEAMDAVSKYAKTFVRAVEKTGGAAKILGGGGRKAGVGYLLCYHARPGLLKEFLERFTTDLTPVRLGEEGVRLEKD